MTTFEIPGPPVAKQRPRRGKNGQWYTPRPTLKFQEAVGRMARAAKLRLERDKRYSVKLDFYLSTHRADADNLCKSVLDGLADEYDDWDDIQVVNLEIHKRSVRLAGEERTVVTVREAI